MPRLSVVMSVYNGEASLGTTLDSIAAQTETDYELIVVDDGSDDGTPSILARRAAADRRIRVITQTNAGLTRALIRGCAEARAPLVARHDCGDRSLPERFARQLAAFDDGVALVSCASRSTGPEGETLFETGGDGDAIRSSLLHDPAGTIRGLPHHGTAMFRRESYIAAGGYRDAFRYAQDLDLWIRMAPLGRIVVLAEVLYEASFELRSISATARETQLALTRLSIAIRDGGDERSLLDKARKISASPGSPGRRDDARALYFIASCLRRNGDMRYKRYARTALHLDPLFMRAWLLLLR